MKTIVSILSTIVATTLISNAATVSTNIAGSHNANKVFTLSDSAGITSSYSLKYVTQSQSYQNDVTAINPEATDYSKFFANTTALNEMISKVGDFDYTNLSTFSATGNAGSRVSPTITGLNIGDTVTLYMFVSNRNESGISSSTNYNVTGGTGTLSYAGANSNGWATEGTGLFDKGQLTLLKWEGTMTSTELAFIPTNGNKNGVAYIAMNVVPEPSTTTLGFLGFSVLLLRRKRNV